MWTIVWYIKTLIVKLSRGSKQQCSDVGGDFTPGRAGPSILFLKTHEKQEIYSKMEPCENYTLL